MGNIDIIKTLKKTIIIKDSADYNRFIKIILEQKKSKVISFINTHAFNICYKNDRFLHALLKSDFLLRDGVGMKILYKKLHINPGINMNGTDFIPVLLNYYKGYRVAVFGTEEPFLSNAVIKLTNKGHNIVCHHDGFSEDDKYLVLAEKFKPELIILAMGMPKQELLSIYLRDNYTSSCLIINGGGIIDFISERRKRAPEWMQNYGLEWLYRFSQDPKRLFIRYFFGNITFFLKFPFINY